MEEYKDKRKERKLFISHSKYDKEYVFAIVDLLESIGLNHKNIVCSSIAPYCIPLNENIYNWLIGEFHKYDLHMIFVLSDAYYRSAPCLNEMGAAWAFKNKWDAILVPGFDFNKIDGCIDKEQISIKLDIEDEFMLKHYLGALKDELIKEFVLSPMDDTIWERKRDEFLQKIHDITINGEEHNENIADNGKITVEMNPDETLLLVYAADDSTGAIHVIGSISRSGPLIETHGYDFAKADTARECARWKAAVDKLEAYHLIEDVKCDGKYYKVTSEGYRVSDILKSKWSINTDKSPYEYYKDNP